VITEFTVTGTLKTWDVMDRLPEMHRRIDRADPLVLADRAERASWLSRAAISSRRDLLLCYKDR
jgi:hypothetical protein